MGERREWNIFEIQKDRPHCVGQIICQFCEHTWTAVYPDFAKELQCPNCRHFTESPKPSLLVTPNE